MREADNSNEIGTAGLRARSLLLASHGTSGARAAEDYALRMVEPGGNIHQLVIVPGLWQGMSGDGWRINASTEHEFCDYLEAQIERETMACLRRMAALASERGILYSASSEFGELEDCLIAKANKHSYDAIVIGAPRAKGKLGLRSALKLEKVARTIPVPLLIVPQPGPDGQ